MLARIREIMGGPASAALVVVMLVGCLFLWVGVPAGWLWIGSQIQASASLGTALAVTMLGIVVSIVVLMTVLSRLNRWHAELLIRRNRAPNSSALEVIMASSAAIAVVGFGF